MCETLNGCQEIPNMESKNTQNSEKIKYVIDRNNHNEKQNIIDEIKNCIKDAIPDQISGPYSIDKFVD
jgi:hypothetical protein